jgi:hypothetical protein
MVGTNTGRGAVAEGCTVRVGNTICVGRTGIGVGSGVAVGATTLIVTGCVSTVWPLSPTMLAITGYEPIAKLGKFTTHVPSGPTTVCPKMNSPVISKIRRAGMPVPATFMRLPAAICNPLLGDVITGGGGTTWVGVGATAAGGATVAAGACACATVAAVVGTASGVTVGMLADVAVAGGVFVGTGVGSPTITITDCEATSLPSLPVARAITS